MNIGAFALGLVVGLGGIALGSGIALYEQGKLVPIDHQLDALRAAQVRSWTAPAPVYLCEEWFCDGAVALPDMCEAEGGTLRRTGVWIGVTDTLTLGLRRPGMMSFRLCEEHEVEPEPCGALAFCGGEDR